MGIRRNRLLSAGLSAAIVVLAMSGTGMQASASTVPGPDFSTTQGIDQYLQSRGIDPGAAIWQNGLDNYVGYSCPGAGWHCIAPTNTPVVQIAPAGGVNEFTCSPATGSGSCFVLQVSAGASAATGNGNATNNFNCVENSSNNPAAVLDAAACGSMTQVNTTGKNRAMIVQNVRQRQSAGASPSALETAGSPSPSASFSQTNTSGDNQIDIEQTSLQYSSDTPTAGQTAYVSQSNGTGNNQANVGQSEQQQVSDATPTQDQEGTQVACVTQDSKSGQNQATVNQVMSQSEQSSAASPSQFQNQTPPVSQSACGTASTSVFPNLAALVLQNQNTLGATGQNQQTVKQSLNQQEQASTASGNVTQQQGPSTDAGGLEAIPDQTSTGLSTLNISQNEQQNMTASTTGTLTQSQQDPMRQPDCSFPDCSQLSNPNDTFTLTQTGVQQADLAGQPNVNAQQRFDIQGDCTTSGTCSIQSTDTSNGVTTSQPASCTALPYSTCTTSTFVEPTTGPICNAGDTTVAYNAMPFDVVNCLNPALGFEAQSASEFGDEVGLAGTARTLVSLSVDFQSFACQSGHWNTGDCASAANATFQWPITANIYAVNTGSACGTAPSPCPGALLATITQTQTIPYRPSATPTCPANSGPAPVGAAWFNPLAPGGGACQNSIGKVLTFSFPAGITLPDQVIWTVAFNTSDYGSVPQRPQPCNSTSVGCPYDSLNVGDKTYPNAPYAGTDIDPYGVFLNSTSASAYCDKGAAGTGFLRLDTPCWTGFRPLGEITTTPGPN
jgi:hypothetical protein